MANAKGFRLIMYGSDSQLDDSIYVHEVSFARVERVRAKNIKRIYKFSALAQG